MNLVDVAQPAISFNTGPFEPFISVNPQDPGNIALSQQTQLQVSNDAGGSYTPAGSTTFPEPIIDGKGRGDTVTAFDTQGRLFWSNLYTTAGGLQSVAVAQINPATGAVIGTAHVVDTPPAGSSDDKDFIAAGTNTNNLYDAWTRFGPSGTTIELSMSSDEGVTWSSPIAVSGAGEGYVWPATLTVGPNGTVYVTYHASPASMDTNGEVWVAAYTPDLSTQLFKDTPFPEGTARIRFLQGNYPNSPFIATGTPASGGSLGTGESYLLADPVRPNTLYVVAANDPSNGGPGDASDIVMAKSVDGGMTWTRSTVYAGPDSSYQVFPNASIDQFGDIFISWYDSQNGTLFNGLALMDVYATYSTDGALSFATPFAVNAPANRLGGNTTASPVRLMDYFSSTLFGGTAYIAWEGGSGTSQQIFTDAVPINGSLTVNGDSGGVLNDNFDLSQIAGNPGFIQITDNGQQEYAGLLSALAGGIQFNGLSGNDTLTVDFSNGNPIPSGGLYFDGGTGANELILQGGAETSETYSPGLSTASGTIAITAGATAATAIAGMIHFDNLSPVSDVVPGPLTVSGTQSNDIINYSVGATTFEGLVTVNNFEPIDFTVKTSLTLQGQAGDDTITINNPNTPTDLAAITVDGGTGDSTLVVNAQDQAITSSDVTSSAVKIPGEKAVDYSNIGQIHIINSTDALINTPAEVAAVEGIQTGTLLVGSFDFSDAGTPTLLGNAGDFTAEIKWGDATPTTAGTIVTNGTNGTTGFQVFGSHTYAEESTPAITVAVTDQGSSRTFTPAGGTTPVTITVNPDAATTTISSTATVVDAPLTGSAGTEITGIEGSTPGTVVLGAFTDANPGAAVADYTTGGGSVVVNWGDGSPPQNLAAGNLTANGKPDGVTFTINAAHTYTEEGTYSYTVTVTDDGGSVTTVDGSAIIADAPLSIAGLMQPPVAQDEPAIFPLPVFSPPLFNGPVAVFSDGNPLPPTGSSAIADFTAEIDWGDGTPKTFGTVLPYPGATTAMYEVTGSHTYADAGTTGKYDIQVFVTDVGGSILTVDNTANVADNPIVLTGALNPKSDSGLSTGAPNTTNVNQPDFLGTSEPFSHVTLFAALLPGGAPVQIGQVQAGSDGSWNFKSQKVLADGHYEITAKAVDQFGETKAGPVTITPDLLIDTTGPVIDGMFFNRLNGQVDYIIKDPVNPDGSAPAGVWVNSLLDSSNYLLTKVHANKAYPGKWVVTNVKATPDPVIPYAFDVAVTFNGGAIIQGGFYLFTIRDSSDGNSSVQDLAENHLDGEFFGSFPSGNGKSGSDFVAELEAYHNKVFAPQTIIGTASPGNKGVGGLPVAPVHSGIWVPAVPVGGPPIFFTPTSPSNGGDPPAKKHKGQVVVKTKHAPDSLLSTSTDEAKPTKVVVSNNHPKRPKQN